MKIYIDGELPESCASCQFLVHCCECEGYENYCPFIGVVGYDLSDNLKDGAPVTPTWERHEECPLEQRPHGKWITKKDSLQTYCSHCDTAIPYSDEYDFSDFILCPYCGADMREGEQE